MMVLGRSRTDCQAVVASLTTPARPILWALQGFLGGDQDRRDLRSEIVLGYEQYREATFNNNDFRAAFIEVFRNRSLMFLGSGLSEEYFRGLFGESLLRLGPGHQAHFALVNQEQVQSGEVNPWFLHTRLNIVVLTYDDGNGRRFSGFAPAIDKICAKLTTQVRRPRRVEVHSNRYPEVSVELVAALLPTERLAADHWTVVSVGKGNNDEIRLGREAKQLLGRARPPKKAAVTTASGGRLFTKPGRRLLLAMARRPDRRLSSRRARDLRAVAELTKVALDEALTHRASIVSMMFLAGDPGHARWSRVFSLVQMLRGIRQFLMTPSGKRPLRILIHDTAAADTDENRDVSAWQAVQSGRLDLTEILDCEAVRFFVEIEHDVGVRRTPMYWDDRKTLASVAEFFMLGGAWHARVEPQPYLRGAELLASSNETLADLGVVPGSTVQFCRERTRERGRDDRKP
jgi:hypothetical protein